MISRTIPGTAANVTLRAEAQGHRTVQSSTLDGSGMFLPKPDTALLLMIRRDRCFVFEAACA